MKIKAIHQEYINEYCLLLGFSDGYAIYLLKNGEIHRCFLNHIKIVDEDYLNILKELQNER
jgi:hypothetical protein